MSGYRAVPAPKSEQEWAELVRGWFPDLADTRLRQVTWPAIGKHHEYITAQLKAGVRMSTIHQRLRDEHGRQRAELAPACPRPRSWSPTCTT